MKKPKIFTVLELSRDKKHFGLWSLERVRNENAVTSTGAIRFLVALVGVAIALNTVKTISDEHAQLGEATSHIGAWVNAVGAVLVGIFLAHGGVIYWWRRLFWSKQMRRR